MSDNFKYRVGLSHVGSYQTSARPFLSSSLTIPDNTSTPLEIEFDNVSRFVVIANTTPSSDPSRPIRFGFSENGVKGVSYDNYAVLDNGQTFEAEFKVTSVFLMSDTANEGSGSIIAGLTGIDASHLPNNWSGSAGVG